MIQHNILLSAKHGAMSEEEALWKSNLADFYLAAKNQQDAQTLYVELLYRMGRCSDLKRLSIAIKLLQSVAPGQDYRQAKAHLTYLMSVDEDAQAMVSESLWTMHLLRGIICQIHGELDLACRHLQRATEIWHDADDTSNGRRYLTAQKALLFKVAEDLWRKKSETLLPWKPLQMLLEWCLEQVEGSDYRSMLSSLPEKPWTMAPNLSSFNDFENTLLLTYLWKKFRDVQNEQLGQPAKEIVLSVKDLEESLQISPPVIFAAITSIRVYTETASPHLHEYSSSAQIAEQAASNLKKTTDLTRSDFYSEVHLISTSRPDLFFKAFASFGADVGGTEGQREFRKLTHLYVRERAEAELPRKAFTLCLEGPEAYVYSIAPMTGIADLAMQDDIKNNDSLAAPHVTPAASTVQLESRISLTTDETGQRPLSSASVDTLATRRSSLSSSKASLRSFQRLGRVAELLLKRGGDSGMTQVPSEVIDRDSHSSWSLRRLTGIPYLRSSSEMAVDMEPEDAIMDDGAV